MHRIHPVGRLSYAVALLALLASAPASALLLLPGGDANLDGSFEGVGYGQTGTAYLTPLLFVGQLGSTQSPASQVLGTDLVYGYSTTGLGTPLWTITYTVGNASSDLVFDDLRFLLNVQVDGSDSFLDVVTEAWPAAEAGDPATREVGLFDFVNPLITQMITNNGLVDGGDACLGSPCDADLGLQWNRASLAPGEIWDISVLLVDDLSLVIGGRYLVATSSDTEATVLAVGNPRIIPELATSVLLAAGLGLLAMRSRRG